MIKRKEFENMSLEDAEQKIVQVLGTPYGHNIIALIIGKVEMKYGEKEADKLFNKYQK